MALIRGSIVGLQSYAPLLLCLTAKSAAASLDRVQRACDDAVRFVARARTVATRALRLPVAYGGFGAPDLRAEIDVARKFARRGLEADRASFMAGGARSILTLGGVITGGAMPASLRRAVFA